MEEGEMDLGTQREQGEGILNQNITSPNDSFGKKQEASLNPKWLRIRIN